MAEDTMITESDLVFDPFQGIEQPHIDRFEIDKKLGLLSLKTIVAEFEATIIHRALQKYSGNVSAVATQLKIGKTALYDKMRQHGLSAKHIKKSG